MAGERLEVLHNGGEVELVACPGETPQAHTLEAVMGFEVRKSHLDLLALVARLFELRRTHEAAGMIAGTGVIAWFTVTLSSKWQTANADLALFNLAIDSRLRGCDVVALKVEDIAPHGYAIERVTVRQKKTGRPVRFEVTEQTRQAID